MKLSQTEKHLVERIAESWSREKDWAQPGAVEREIQFQLRCSWGKALTLANEIRARWPAV
ncbi:MAG: hypothetical protein AB1425_18465 [Actinomycetota bacterium]